MASIDCVLDTTPMAQEIGSVSNHVKATTTAVVAMQTAVVLAEKNAAEHVCNNVNKGFHTLMLSQISQKRAKCQSDVDSLLMLLNQQQKQLLTIKWRMERDYNMLSNRYLKLFNGLNANLKQRVFELDRPVINFAVRDIEKVSNRTKYLTATVPVTQLESLSISQKILASNVKYRGLNVIDSMTRFLGGMQEQKKLTDRILLNRSKKPEDSTLLIPIIISEMNYDKSDNKNIEITLSNRILNRQSETILKNAVMPHVENLQGQKNMSINKDVQSEFSKLVSSSNISQRVKDLTNSLFATNNYPNI